MDKKQIITIVATLVLTFAVTRVLDTWQKGVDADQVAASVELENVSAELTSVQAEVKVLNETVIAGLATSTANDVAIADKLNTVIGLLKK